MSDSDIIWYDPRLIPRARKLRKRMTKAEKRLWQIVRRKQISGVRFLRQRPLDRYIVDFYCPAARLVIEIDGISHDTEGKYTRDMERQQQLEALGLTVLRFNDRDVLQDDGNVLRAIEQAVRLSGATNDSSNDSSVSLSDRD